MSTDTLRPGEWRCPGCGGIKAASCKRCVRCERRWPSEETVEMTALDKPGAGGGARTPAPGLTSRKQRWIRTP